MNAPSAEVIRSHHALRGVAAVLVLLYHFRDVTPSVGQAIDSHTAFFSAGRIWVEFFFVLGLVIGNTVSGSCISHILMGRTADEFALETIAHSLVTHDIS